MKNIFKLTTLMIWIFILSGCQLKDNFINEVDFSNHFSDYNGCAVFYKNNYYDIYQKSKINIQESPCSTFKIVLTLAGLKYGILEDEYTLIKWDGVQRYFDSWNKDLTLKEAFNLSAVWCFEKIATDIGKQKLYDFINHLSYGNCDTSSDIPFWNDASLRISPKEQVDFIYNLFNNRFDIDRNHIQMLKQIMNKGIIKDGTLYGKTGTSGENKNGWFVGFYEKNNECIYFAVRLFNGENVSGLKAEEITKDIISNNY